MRIPGKRFKRTRLVRTNKYIVAVEIEVVVPIDDPDEACLESETVAFLREVQERAERDEVEWLSRHGKVYAALEAA